MNAGKVAVVGAGLSGLNAARNLQSSGYEVRVYEAGDRVGGRVTSDRVDGFICDRGFQVINPAYSELRETGLVQELDIRSLPKGICIVDGDKELIVGDPRNSLNFVFGDLSPRSGSLKEKFAFLRYLRDETEEVSFGAAMNEVGSLYDRVLAPFLKGVFLTQPDGVSNRMARELIHWFIKGKPGLPVGGVQRLPELLSKGLDIRFNQRVRAIDGTTIYGDGWTEECDAIIVAADPKNAAALVNLNEPRTLRCTTWYHALPSGSIATSLLRAPVDGPLVNSIVLSNTATDYAPLDRQLLSTTSLEPMGDSQVLAELQKLWRSDLSGIELIARYEIEDALPEHTVEHPLLGPLKILDGVYVAGDWRAIPAQQGALLTGRLVAARVKADLQAR